MKSHYPLLKKVILWLLTMIVLAACTPATEETTAPPATIAVERPTTIPTVEEATAISIATKEATAMPIAGDVLIRIYNKTGLDLETIRVQFPSQTEDYGSLANGTSSDFHIIHEAYRYAFIQVNSGDQAYVLQPIDYVGETLLAPGYYTYSLRRSGPNLMLDLIEGDEPLPMQPSLEPEATEKPESIIIFNPGLLSQITSPFTLTGESDFPFEGTLEVQVVAYEQAETAVVGTGFVMLNGEFGERSPYDGIVEFIPPTEPTPGRVIVISTSPMHGQPHHLASVPVTLMPADATAVINPASPQPEAIAIYSPIQGDDIAGGTIHITGFAAPTFEQNLVIEILDEQGATVGSGFATIAAGMGESGTFEADVAYSVSGQNTGAVCVQDLDARDGGMIHRTCVTVHLFP
jgi:hypothetical protein